jgi:template-activating factor I
LQTGGYVIDVFDEAIKYFFNKVEEFEDEDVTDSESEAADEGDEEIDLEQPRKKKVRKMWSEVVYVKS